VEFIVIDCPPRIDEWAWTALSVSDEVIVPVQAEFFALQGLAQALQIFRHVGEQRGKPLAITGILPSIVADDSVSAREVLDDLRTHFPELLMQATVPRVNAFSVAASHGKTLFEYDCFSRGALAMIAVTREVIHGRKKARQRPEVPAIRDRARRSG
jgi:chromosome partitioning protein